MTTSTPSRITITHVPRIVDDEDAMQQLTDGLENAIATLCLNVPEIERAFELHDDDGEDGHADPPGIVEWSDEVEGAAVAEVAPAVAALLQAAIEKRLPWSKSAA